MDAMKENMLGNMNWEAFSIKDLIRYKPDAVDDIYYHLGKMHSYEEMYKELFKEDIPEPTLKNMTHASMMVDNWERRRRK